MRDSVALLVPFKEHRKMADDVLHYGTGFLRVLPSGKVEHIPLEQVMLQAEAKQDQP
jgi:hypothetical protein